MRYIGIKSLPATLRAKTLNFKPLLAKLRRDQWLELTLKDFRKLTGSKTKELVTVLRLDDGQQRVVSRIRTVNGEKMMFARLY